MGKDIDSFRRTKIMLSQALKGSVDSKLPIEPYHMKCYIFYKTEHYQAFAAALPHHSSLLSHLGSAQSQITDTRTALQEAKDALGNKRSDLVQLWSRGQTIEEMLRLLDQMNVLPFLRVVIS